MNTRSLAQHYDALTPWERVSLIAAAMTRGDNVESDRLIRSAPTSTFRVPDHLGLVDGMYALAGLYVQRQLNLAVYYWRVQVLMANRALLRDGVEESPLCKDLRLLAYRYVINADAWRLLGAELHLDAEVFLKDILGYETVREVEECVRLMAYTAEEASAYVRQCEQSNSGDGPEAGRPHRFSTAADEVQMMRKFLEQRVAEWT